MEFHMFDFTHILSLVLIFVVMVMFPFFVNKYLANKISLIAKIIAFFGIFHSIFSPIKDLYFVIEPYDWREVLPFHMCDLSLIFISIFLLGGSKFYFNCAFFWGIAGASMALITPDLQFGFPSMDYLTFFWGHALILFGVFFALISMNTRPYFSEMNKVILFTLVLLIPIYLINVALGEPANYWYLAAKPAAGSLMDFFPEPPLHLLVTTPIALSLFYVIYFPLFLRDRLKT